MPSVIEAIREAVRAVAARHADIAVVYLYGSTARGDARAWSDIDIGVVYRGMASPAEHDRVAVALALEVSRATGNEAIDVVDLGVQGYRSSTVL